MGRVGHHKAVCVTAWFFIIGVAHDAVAKPSDTLVSVQKYAQHLMGPWRVKQHWSWSRPRKTSSRVVRWLGAAKLWKSLREILERVGED